MQLKYSQSFSNFLKTNNLSVGIFLVIILIILETFAQTFLQKSTDNLIFMLPGTLCYGASAILYGFLLKTGMPLAIANSVWQAAVIIAVTIISIFYFKEKITKLQIVGILFIMVGSTILA